MCAIMLAYACLLHITQVFNLALTIKLKCHHASSRRTSRTLDLCSLCVTYLFSALLVCIIRISQHCNASRTYSLVLDRSLGTDASENVSEEIAEVPECVIEPDQQQDQGKQLRILTLTKSNFVNESPINCYYIYILCHSCMVIRVFWSVGCREQGFYLLHSHP